MTSTIEYIENYFAGALSDNEKSAFENKCETDEAFAKEVAFYILARENIQRELHTKKKNQFNKLYKQLSTRKNKPYHILRKLSPYLSFAVACILLFFGWLLFFNNPSPQKLANAYVEENLQTLSITMNGSQDSLQLGISAFNKKNYLSAERIFRALKKQPTLGPEATKNLGILYLVTGQFGEALLAFDSLSVNKNLYANPGPFYKAITLMQRDEGRDLKDAKIILQEVIDKQLPGNKEAERWIDDW
jgi:hypothetical protein